MARLHGVRERRDTVFYDTHEIMASDREFRFFGNRNIGNYWRTNLQVSGQTGSNDTFVILAVGLRLIGKTREQEDLLLDHLRLRLIVGDSEQLDLIGPVLSTLRHVTGDLSEEERVSNIVPVWGLLRALAAERGLKHAFDMKLNSANVQVISDWLEERGLVSSQTIEKFKDADIYGNPQPGRGYTLSRPCIIPVRQNFSVEVSASLELPEPVTARALLFGLRTRDV